MKKKLFMVLLGCRPVGRLTEQHDVFFGIGSDVLSLVPAMKKFWPGVNLHIDAYQSIEIIDNYTITVHEGQFFHHDKGDLKLFFINMGGYKPPLFEEMHSKILVVAKSISEAICIAKTDAFYVDHQNNEGRLRSHIDDKFDIDDVLNVNDLILDYGIEIRKFANGDVTENELKIGYIPLSNL